MHATVKRPKKRTEGTKSEGGPRTDSSMQFASLFLGLFCPWQSTFGGFSFHTAKSCSQITLMMKVLLE
jgi:hypothetical protein